MNRKSTQPFAGSTSDQSGMSTERLKHELKVHQIELETQNEELRETQLKLEKTLKDYKTLYHHSPVGYITLNNQGRIVELNATFSIMCGKTIVDIKNNFLFQFLTEDQKAGGEIHRICSCQRKRKRLC